MKRFFGLIAFAFLSSCFLSNQSFAAESEELELVSSDGSNSEDDWSNPKEEIVITRKRFVYRPWAAELSDEDFSKILNTIGDRHCLEELCLKRALLYKKNMKILAEGLITLKRSNKERGSRLKILSLRDCIETCAFEVRLERLKKEKNLQILLDAISEGCCPALQVLNLSKNNLGNRGLQALFNVLGAGHCPQLRELYLHGNNPKQESDGKLSEQREDDDERVRLAWALPSLPQLQKLRIDQTRITYGDVKEAVEAFKKGACPELQSFSMPNFDERETDTLVEDIKKFCPKLRRLNFWNLRDFSEEEEETSSEPGSLFGFLYDLPGF